MNITQEHEPNEGTEEYKCPKCGKVITGFAWTGSDGLAVCHDCFKSRVRVTRKPLMPLGELLDKFDKICEWVDSDDDTPLDLSEKSK